MHGKRFAVVVGDRAAALDADGHDERVEVGELQRLGGGQGQQRRGEIGARNQLHAAVLRRGVVRPVVGQHGVVDGLLGQLGVQFAGVAVGIAAVEVVDAVGDVRSLLDLGDEGSGADRMHAARRQEENVAWMDLVVGEDVGDGVVLYAGGVFGGRHLLRESRAEVRPLVGGHDVPHLGFALGLVAFPGQFVVGVNLDREVLPGVDELDEQRELLAEALEILRAQQSGSVAGDQFGQRGSGLGASGDDGFVAFHARELPALADLLLRGLDLFVRGYLVAAPDQRFQNRLKLIHGLSYIAFYNVRSYQPAVFAASGADPPLNPLLGGDLDNG